jgi:hypothetical protein
MLFKDGRDGRVVVLVKGDWLIRICRSFVGGKLNTVFLVKIFEKFLDDEK